MNTPTILTVILNYRTPEMTLKSAAAAVREMDGLRGEILIIDNDSRDDSFDMISREVASRGWDRDNHVRVVQSGHNGGFGAGNNIAFEIGLSNGEKPDFYYLLNSDAWPEPGAIHRLRDFMIAYPRAGMAGSSVFGDDGAPHRTAFRFPSIAGEFEAAARTGFISRWLKDSIVAITIPQQDAQVDWVAGASLMMRSQMLDEIGVFDETFFLYFEETDLSRRAARAGWRTHYVPGSVVTHIGSVSTGMKTWRRTPQYWFDSRLYYYSKNHGATYATLATLSRIGGCMIWQLRRLISNKPQVDPEGFLGDLITHSVRALFRRGSNPTGVAHPQTPINRTVMEDRK